MNRREFIRKGSAFAAISAFIGLRSPLNSSVSSIKGNSSNGKINIGFIGVGRMGQLNIINFLGFPDFQITAVCDFDAHRAADAKKIVDQKHNNKDCRIFRDYSELLADRSIDAVVISTPDHWHGRPAIEAAIGGKDIFIEKPITFTIQEGRRLCTIVKEKGLILQTNSWQRSERKFRQACELVRNGYLGKIKAIRIGLPMDSGIPPQVLGNSNPPAHFDYKRWLGGTPEIPYQELRVHPQKGYDRPGWLRNEFYTRGMIAGWGAHHIDIAHWGMGVDDHGPLSVTGSAQFYQSEIWNVHQDFRLEYCYPKEIKLIVADQNQEKLGVLFEGSEGWVFVTREQPLAASSPSLLNVKLTSRDSALYRSDNHVQNFLESIRSRKEPVSSAEVSHRTNSACVLGWAALKLNQELHWDFKNETVINNLRATELLNGKAVAIL